MLEDHLIESLLCKKKYSSNEVAQQPKNQYYKYLKTISPINSPLPMFNLDEANRIIELLYLPPLKVKIGPCQ